MGAISTATGQPHVGGQWRLVALLVVALAFAGRSKAFPLTQPSEDGLLLLQDDDLDYFSNVTAAGAGIIDDEEEVVATGNFTEEVMAEPVVQQPEPRNDDEQEGVGGGGRMAAVRPVDLTFPQLTQNSITLQWRLSSAAAADEGEPGEAVVASEQVEVYRIYYKRGTYKDVKTTNSNLTRYTLSNLNPYTECVIWVEGVIQGSGRVTKPSNEITVYTDVDQPGPPVITSLKCEGTGSLYLQWNRPQTFHKSVDHYTIFYRVDSQSNFQKKRVKATHNSLTENYVIKDLSGNNHYVVKICAETTSLSKPGQTYMGVASREFGAFLPLANCEGLTIGDSTVFIGAQSGAGGGGAGNGSGSGGESDNGLDGGELSAEMIGGAVCAVLFLLIAVSGFVVWRQYFKAAYYYLDEPHRPAPPASGIPNWENEPGPEGQRGPVAASDFEDHVYRNHADSDSGFSKEYNEIQKFCAKSVKTTHEHSAHPDNKCKNRYLNIVAYDHTRVKLMPVIGQKKTSDYINANFIDGFRKCNAYIGTQGPLEDTREAFWRMIWEQNVHVVVMITNLMERGRRKCDIYWPKEEGTELYGQIAAQLEKEEVMADFTVRTIKIKHIKDCGDKSTSVSTLKRKKGIASERVVKQFHYTSWPDHGVPCHPLPVLTFVRKSVAANPSSAAATAAAGTAASNSDQCPAAAAAASSAVSGAANGGAGATAVTTTATDTSAAGGGGPIVVHCSAGVGRTGTYITIDAMLQQMFAAGEFNVYGFLKHIRGQRNHLVQTEEQYVFIHDALVEAMRSGNTEIERERLSDYVEKLHDVVVTPPLAVTSSSKKVADANNGGVIVVGSSASSDDGKGPTQQEKAGDSGACGDSAAIAAAGKGKEEMMEMTTNSQPPPPPPPAAQPPPPPPPVAARLPETVLSAQFKLVTEFAPSEYNYMSAQKEVNKAKNRDPALVPVEAHRIPLAPKPGVDGSDYINASWLNGHNKLKEFIISQHPIAQFKGDFWRMLWDHNAQTVVLLSTLSSATTDDHDDSVSHSSSSSSSAVAASTTEFPTFWPKEGELDCQTFRVRFVEETVHQDSHSTFDLVVSSQHDDYELAVRIIYCPEWHSLEHVDLVQAFSVLKVVQDWHLEYQDGPLVVVDRFGGTEAATFCALTTLCKQLESSNSLDVYQVAKLYHIKRPGIWKSADDILYLYKAMATLIASKYANPLQDAGGGPSNDANGGPPVAKESNGGIVAAIRGGGGGAGSVTGETDATGDIAGVIERRHSASASSNLTTDWCANGNGNGNGGAGSRRHSLPSEANGGVVNAVGNGETVTSSATQPTAAEFSSLPVTTANVTSSDGNDVTKEHNGNGFAVAINATGGGSASSNAAAATATDSPALEADEDEEEDFEDEDLSETAALTQTTRS